MLRWNFMKVYLPKWGWENCRNYMFVPPTLSIISPESIVHKVCKDHSHKDVKILHSHPIQFFQEHHCTSSILYHVYYLWACFPLSSEVTFVGLCLVSFSERVLCEREIAALMSSWIFKCTQIAVHISIEAFPL